MRILPTLPLVALLSAVVAGCAVEATPSGNAPSIDAPSTDAPPAEAPATSHAAHAEGVGVGGIFLCLGSAITDVQPLSCIGFTSYETTPDASYAQSCTGQAYVELATPACNGHPYIWDVVPGGIADLATVYTNLPQKQCEQTYVDATLTIQSASTGQWHQVSSERTYGTYANGRCTPPYAGTQELPTADMQALQISADAYEPAYWGNLFLGMYPVPLTIRVTPG